MNSHKQTSFVAVNPKRRTIETIRHGEFNTALRAAGLEPGAVDHGSIARGVGYVVAEFGLFTPVAEQHYFGIGRRLVAGNALFYGVDEAGETIDLLRSQLPNFTFYLGANDVEAAIERGEIDRPQMSVNGEKMWAWPEPAPAGFTR